MRGGTAVIFQTEDPCPGAPAAVRRSIGHGEFEGPHVKKLLEVCEALKLETSLRPWRASPDVWAHVAVPSRKTCFLFNGSRDHQRVDKMRAGWKQHGWRMISVQIQDIVRTPM